MTNGSRVLSEEEYEAIWAAEHPRPARKPMTIADITTRVSPSEMAARKNSRGRKCKCGDPLCAG